MIFINFLFVLSSEITVVRLKQYEVADFMEAPRYLLQNLNYSETTFKVFEIYLNVSQRINFPFCSIFIILLKRKSEFYVEGLVVEK